MISTGFIKSVEIGMHHIEVFSDEGVRVFLEEKLVLDNWSLVRDPIFEFFFCSFDIKLLLLLLFFFFFFFTAPFWTFDFGSDLPRSSFLQKN